MDNAEAAALLKDHLEGYRLRSYADLVTLLGKPQVVELRGASGATSISLRWRFIGMIAPAVRCVSSAPSMTAAGGRYAHSATTSSWRPTGVSLESKTMGCLTSRWSGRASRAAQHER